MGLYKCLFIFVLFSFARGDDEEDAIIKLVNQGIREAQDASEKILDSLKDREELEPTTGEGRGESPDEPDAAKRGIKMATDMSALFKIPLRRSWWSGVNVCAEERNKEEKDVKDGELSKDFFFTTAQISSCRLSPTKYSCKTVTKKNGVTKTQTINYRCCEGYGRNGEDTQCVQAGRRSIGKVLSEAGAGKFGQELEESEKLTGRKTVFAPRDEVWLDYLGEGTEKQETNDVEDALRSGRRAERSEVLRRHVVKGTFDTVDMENDMVLESVDGGKLRINYFPGRDGPRLTVNCVSVNSTNFLLDSGVAHTLDGVLTTPTKTVLEILSQPKYSKFLKLLRDNDLMKELEGPGPFTVFAVDDDHMEGISTDNACIKSVLRHQILSHTVCSAAADRGRISAVDISGHWLVISRDPSGRVLLDQNVTVLETDDLALDGLVHGVERLVVPNSAKSVSEVLERSNHTKFLELLVRTDLLETVESTPGLTLFVPKDSLLVTADSMDTGELRDLIKYHVASDPRGTYRLDDGLELKSLYGSLITIHTYSNILSGILGPNSVATAQCVKLTRLNGKVCNGVLHEIDGILTPPVSSLYELIQTTPEFAAFKEALNGTNLESELRLGLGKPATILVPTTDSLRKMGDGNYDTLLRDKPLADQILRSHVLLEPLCCSGIGVTSWPFVSLVRTLSGTTLEIKSEGVNVSFGGVKVLKCDVTASDGVAHLVTGVMLPAGQKRNTDIIFKQPNSEIILTGF